MEIGEMYVQELVRAGELTVSNIDGKRNPANVLTKHIGTKELQEQLTNLGMIILHQKSSYWQDSMERKHFKLLQY